MSLSVLQPYIELCEVIFDLSRLRRTERQTKWISCVFDPLTDGGDKDYQHAEGDILGLVLDILQSFADDCSNEGHCNTARSLLASSKGRFSRRLKMREQNLEQLPQLYRDQIENLKRRGKQVLLDHANLPLFLHLFHSAAIATAISTGLKDVLNIIAEKVSEDKYYCDLEVSKRDKRRIQAGSSTTGPSDGTASQARVEFSFQCPRSDGKLFQKPNSATHVVHIHTMKRQTPSRHSASPQSPSSSDDSSPAHAFPSFGLSMEPVATYTSSTRELGGGVPFHEFLSSLPHPDDGEPRYAPQPPFRSDGDFPHSLSKRPRHETFSSRQRRAPSGAPSFPTPPPGRPTGMRPPHRRAPQRPSFGEEFLSPPSSGPSSLAQNMARSVFRQGLSEPERTIDESTGAPSPAIGTVRNTTRREDMIHTQKISDTASVPPHSLGEGSENDNPQNSRDSDSKPVSESACEEAIAERNTSRPPPSIRSAEVTQLLRTDNSDNISSQPSPAPSSTPIGTCTNLGGNDTDSPALSNDPTPVELRGEARFGSGEKTQSSRRQGSNPDEDEPRKCSVTGSVASVLEGGIADVTKRDVSIESRPIETTGNEILRNEENDGTTSDNGDVTIDLTGGGTEGLAALSETEGQESSAHEDIEAASSSHARERDTDMPHSSCRMDEEHDVSNSNEGDVEEGRAPLLSESIEADITELRNRSRADESWVKLVAIVHPLEPIVVDDKLVFSEKVVLSDNNRLLKNGLLLGLRSHKTCLQEGRILKRIRQLEYDPAGARRKLPEVYRAGAFCYMLITFCLGVVAAVTNVGNKNTWFGRFTDFVFVVSSAWVTVFAIVKLIFDDADILRNVAMGRKIYRTKEQIYNFLGGDALEVKTVISRETREMSWLSDTDMSFARTVLSGDVHLRGGIDVSCLGRMGWVTNFSCAYDILNATSYECKREGGKYYIGKGERGFKGFSGVRNTTLYHYFKRDWG